MQKLQYNKTDHKTLLILGNSAYMFRHQDAILREFILKNDSKSNTYFRCLFYIFFYIM